MYLLLLDPSKTQRNVWTFWHLEVDPFFHMFGLFITYLYLGGWLQQVIRRFTGVVRMEASWDSLWWNSENNTKVDSHHFYMGVWNMDVCLNHTQYESRCETPTQVTRFLHSAEVNFRMIFFSLGGSRSKTRNCIRITGNARFPTVDGRFESLLFTWF